MFEQPAVAAGLDERDQAVADLDAEAVDGQQLLDRGFGSRVSSSGSVVLGLVDLGAVERLAVAER